MKHGTEEWYLYHNIKNERPVIPLIVSSPFLLIIKGGIFLVIIAWICYFAWASNNNEKLNRDPEIIIKRLQYNAAKRDRENFINQIKRNEYEEQLRKIEKMKKDHYKN